MIKSIIYHIAENNPGAIRVCIELAQIEDSNTELIFLYLMANKITGAKLWELYKDVHSEDVVALRKNILKRIEDEDN